MCKRIDAHQKKSQHAWQMPQGGIDNNESPENAAFRELLEETGVKSVKVLQEHSEWLYYDFPLEVQKKFSHSKTPKGQFQKWFLMRFLGEDSEINLSQDYPEFCEYAWANKQEVLERVVPFKKNVYKQVIQEFNDWLS